MKAAGASRLFLALCPDDGTRVARARCRDAWAMCADAVTERTEKLHLTGVHRCLDEGQPGKARSVASLPSWSPLRMAVKGRQNWKWSLASKTASMASPPVCANTARKRALRVTSRPGWPVTERASR